MPSITAGLHTLRSLLSVWCDCMQLKVTASDTYADDVKGQGVGSCLPRQAVGSTPNPQTHAHLVCTSCNSEAETGKWSSPENRAVIAAWTRSNSLFSSPNNMSSRGPISLNAKATAFCSFKPFHSSSSSASLLQEHCWTPSCQRKVTAQNSRQA